MSLREVCTNYDKLTANLSDIEENPDGSSVTPLNDMEAIRQKLEIIDRMITDLNIEIEDLNFEVLQHKVTLSDQDRQDFDDMVITRKTLKAFSPLIMWFNLQQKMGGTYGSPHAPPSLICIYLNWIGMWVEGGGMGGTYSSPPTICIYCDGGRERGRGAMGGTVGSSLPRKIEFENQLFPYSLSISPPPKNRIT